MKIIIPGMGTIVRKKKIFIHFIIIFFYLLSIFCYFCPVVSSSSMNIEILPPKPVSGQNFTVSVYDINLTNETPYLTQVHIEFQKNNYTITDTIPNREIEITAPVVYTPTTFIINASKQGYNDSNKTFTILPDEQNPPRVIITLISDHIDANTFFTLKVTDEWNNPIPNATVSIQNHQGQNTDGTTNESGYISLKAPNEQEIIILAQKEGYEEDTFTTWVQTRKDSTQEIFSHPFTPIIIAGIILFLTILFVTLKNKGIISKPQLSLPKANIKDIEEKNNSTHDLQKTQQRTNKLKSNEKPQFQTSKIEEIKISKPHSQTETIHLKSNNTQIKKEQKKSSHQWFSNNESIEDKVDQILSDKSENNSENEWYRGTSIVREVIDSSIKEKQKKKKRKST